MHPFAQIPVILVIADVEETRTGIERLLSADGYRLLAAKGPADAARMSRDVSPDLVLVSLGVNQVEAVLTARQIRNAWELTDDVPIVLFAVTTLEEGADVKIEPNIYLSHPDNFNQLRKLISRLVGRPERIH
jgi:CheY-like chemotaxis protein